MHHTVAANAHEGNASLAFAPTGWKSRPSTFTSVSRASPDMVDRRFGSLVSIASSITAALAALDVMLQI